MLNIVMHTPKSFCILPWISLESTAAGWVKPCCMYNNNIVDANNQPFNLSNNTLSDAWNNQQKYFVGKITPYSDNLLAIFN